MKNEINTNNFDHKESKDINTILQGWDIMETESFPKNESDEKPSNTVETPKDSETKSTLDDNEWVSSGEDIYKQKILDESWIQTSKYLNKEEFEKNITSFHNFESHCSRLESLYPKKTIENLLSQPLFFSLKTTKILCRAGVSPKYMHNFLLKLFDINKVSKEDYDDIFLLTFKNHNPENLENYVPYFSGYTDLKDSLPFHYLTKEGILKTKILLWMISNLYPSINFSPIIIHLISLILIFCDEYETFEIMKKLIEQDINSDINETYKIRWRLRFNFEGNMKIIPSIAECLKATTTNKIVKEFYEYAENVNYNLENEFYQKICFHFFFGIFNFYGLIRLLPFFLKEGTKSIYRLIYAIETLNASKLLSTLRTITLKKFNKNSEKINLLSTVQEFCKKNENIDLIFEESYKVKINRNNNSYISQREVKNECFIKIRNDYYLPKVTGGDILEDKEIIHLWEILPTDYKIKNISLIYQASKDGYNLSNIIGLEEKYDKKLHTMLLIETDDQDKFGFIISSLLTHTDNKYFRPSASYLFTVKPNYNIYTAGDSDEILYVTTKHFIFGNGKNGPAIHLNEDVKQGDSYGGGCFNNPSLVKDKGGHFTVTKIEIFKFE